MSNSHNSLQETSQLCTFQPVSNMPPTQKVATGIPSVDKMLQGGINEGSVTEVCGEAGAGKTQLAMWCAITTLCQSPQCRVVVFSSEPFPHSRMSDFATTLSAQSHVPVQELLERVLIKKVTTVKELADGFQEIRALRKLFGVPLVIVDSITAVVSSDTSNILQVGDMLQRMAHETPSAVLVTNQVRSRMGGGNVAALGLSWSQCIHTRLFLIVDRQRRRRLQVGFACELSSTLFSFFDITTDGLS